MEKYYQLLRNHPLFENVPDDKICTVIECFNGTIKYYKERTLLFPLEQPIPCLGITLEGCTEVFLSNSNGTPFLMQQASPGE